MTTSGSKAELVADSCNGDSGGGLTGKANKYSSLCSYLSKIHDIKKDEFL